jgi:hypothetical protein
MDDNWVPILGILCVFGLPIGGWIIMRILDHRERMAMLQRGMMPPPNSRFGRKYARAMEQGWAPPPTWNAGNVPPPPQYVAYDDPNSPQCLLRKGITTAMVGVALLIGLSFIGYHGGDGPFEPASIHPGPWLLGGLIPMFVGIAQIITALLSGAQFTLMRNLGAPPPNAAPPPPYPNGSSPFPNYGPPPEPGRPGARYEELARPVPPPDRT